MDDQDEKPVLDERTFDKLLEAAHVLQEHNRKMRELEARMEAHNQRLREQELAEQAPPPKSKPDAEPTANSSDYTLTLAEIVEAQRQIQVRHLALNKAVAVVAEKLAHITTASGAAIGMVEEKKVRYVAGSGTPALPLRSEVPLATEIYAASIRTGRVIRSEDANTEFLFLGPRSEARQEIPVAEVNSYASPSRSERLREWTAPMASRQYFAAAIAIFALAGLLTNLDWKPWHRTERTVVRSTKTLPRVETVPASAAMMETRGRLNIAEPGALGRNVTVEPGASLTPSDHSSKVEAQRVARVQPLSRKDEVKDLIVVPSLSSQTRDRVGPANTPELLAPIPLIGTTGGFGKDADVADSALLLQANLPVMASQGVSGGSLERKVQPIYPEKARSTGLQGPVVLQFVIDEVGEVRNLRTASGDAVLARAAIDAVRQWHYQPYRLNGQPVKMPVQITVNFTLP